MSSARSRRPRKSGTSTSICVAGERSRTARMQSTKCCAPPSRRSSRSTLVMTTYVRRNAAIVFGEVDGLVGVERQRAAMADVAERAAARADVAHDHERRRALAEALADVRARRFLAHRVQVVLAQDLLDLEEARRRRRAHADPRWLPQRLGRDHLDRDARGLAGALLLDAGFDADGPRRRRRRCGDAPTDRSTSAQRCPARPWLSLTERVRRARARDAPASASPATRTLQLHAERRAGRSRRVPDSRTGRCRRTVPGPSRRSARGRDRCSRCGP